MKVFYKQLTKKYGLEISYFHRIREFSDGIIFFELNLNLDLFKYDHNPKFCFELYILNYKIFGLNIYNLYHS